MYASPGTLPSAIDADKLDKLADVAIGAGLRVKPGQDVVLTAPVESLPLVRRIVERAYKAGARLVTPIFGDEALALIRYENAPDESFDADVAWLYEGMGKAFADGAARMAIYAEDPMLLSGQDPNKVSRSNRARAAASTPAREPVVNFDINWSICSYPTLSWAKRLFPDLGDEDALGKLAEAIFAASRVLGEDPLADWKVHSDELGTRRDWLNDMRFSALKYTGPGTDLTIGLADGHEWAGGAATANNGVTCICNIPTEEVFTTPHARRVDGTVRSTKPLSHAGTLIEGIEVRFENGRIVDGKAAKGEEVFLKLIDTDDGARRLGEVALVPHSSPISQSGLLFFNTLLDENAASHIALGQCYRKTFVEGATLSDEQVDTQGGNKSLIHVDWMIGSGEIDIDGITQDGKTVPVMRQGEWA